MTVRSSTLVRVLSVLLLAAVAVGCGSDETAEAPDGFRLIEHPEAVVAVPDAWTDGDPGEFLDADPDYVELTIADPPDDGRFGARLGHYDRTQERTFRDAEDPVSLDVGVYPQDREQLRRESIEIDGADEGFLLQIQADSPVVDEPVRVTFVSGLREDGAVILLTITGTASQIPDDVIATMVDSLTLTEPVALDDPGSEGDS